MWITTKPATKAKQEHNGDFISDMPDEIVCHIISFLPLADAFSVKLLSCRFRRTQVPLSHLYFNKETVFGERPGYLNIEKLNSEFVGKVNLFLKLFRGTYLNTFVVEFCLDHEYALDVDSWIRFAISMEVESVELDFHVPMANSPNLYKFPFSILPKPKSLTRLKHLKLSKCSFDLDHSPLSLNCLKTIELKMLSLDQTSLDRLLLSCSELESLTIKNCDAPSALKRVTFVVVPPLQRVYLGFLNPYWLETFYVPLRKIRHKLQSLTLGWFTGYAHIPANIPDIISVNQLEIFTPYQEEFDLQSITNIMNVCPLLQKLHVDLHGTLPINLEDETEEVVLDYSETVKYSNLEEIEMSGFYGSWDQMEFVGYLLQHAINLKHVTLIYSRFKLDPHNWQNACKDALLNLPLEKQVILDSLHKYMTSRDAKLVIC